jgi:hypothetical protein
VRIYRSKDREVKVSGRNALCAAGGTQGKTSRGTAAAVVDA